MKDISKYEPTDLKIAEIAEALNADVSLENIDRSNRIEVDKPYKPRDIIVKFKSYRARNILYKDRVDLKSRGYPRVFINESFTQICSSLFYKAMQLVKRRFLHSAWTYDGNIMIKDASHKILIESAKFLPLKVYPLPLEIMPIKNTLLWHGKSENHKPSTWLREHIFNLYK